MIPGLASDATVWERTIAALGETAECTVGDTLSDDTIGGMAKRILTAAPPRFALAGVSMGGMVAMEIMRLAPGRVTHLALFDTYAGTDSEAMKDERRKMIKRLEAAIAANARPSGALPPGLVHADVPGDVTVALIGMSANVSFRTYIRQLEALMVRRDQRDTLAAVRVPTFIVVGDADEMTPRWMSEEIAAAVPGAELRVIPGCGHLPPIEQPEASAALIVELLGR